MPRRRPLSLPRHRSAEGPRPLSVRQNPHRIGRYLALFAVGVLVCGGLVGCGDDDDNGPTGPPPGLEPPQNLEADNGDRQVLLRWDASPSEGRDDFSRYNVYRSTSTLLDVSPAELEPNRVETVRRGESMPVETGVQNGILYYYHVRTELADGTLSGPSNEVVAAGREEGEGIVLMEFAGTGPSGFDFSGEQPVSMQPGNPDRYTQTDLYLGTVHEGDDSAFQLNLKSPNLRPEQQWQETQIKILGVDWDVNTTEDVGWSDQAVAAQGLVYAVKTPAGSYAKIQVTGLQGLAGSRTITFRYSYQPNPGIREF